MNETYIFFKEKTKVNFVSTVNGDKPRCRPFGDPILFDNKIYVITNKQKNVSKQIAENNNVCIVAYDNENWIRINCQLIEAGYTLDNPDFQVLYMANVDSTIYNEDGDIIANYKF